MRKLFTLLFTLLLSAITIISQAQDKQTGSFTVSAASSFEIGDKKLIDKHTGEIIPHEQFEKRINENPSIIVNPVIDEFGEMAYFLVEMDNHTGQGKSDFDNRISSGNKFPPFHMTTIEGEKVSSDSLKGQFIVLFFQLLMNKPIFNEELFQRYEQVIARHNANQKVTSIMVSIDSEKKITSVLNTDEHISQFVGGGQNWSSRYLISHYPSLILIDPKGNLVSYFDTIDLSKLDKLLTAKGK